jgi:hypothetical protein
LLCGGSYTHNTDPNLRVFQFRGAAAKLKHT